MPATSSGGGDGARSPAEREFTFQGGNAMTPHTQGSAPNTSESQGGGGIFGSLFGATGGAGPTGSSRAIKPSGVNQQERDLDALAEEAMATNGQGYSKQAAPAPTNPSLFGSLFGGGAAAQP